MLAKSVDLARQRFAIMTALTEAINAAGLTAVAATLTADPTWRIFNMLWTAPTDIIKVCNEMGFQTVEDAVGWAARVNAAMGTTAQTFERLIDPPLDVNLGLLPSVPFAEIHKAIAEQCLLREDFFIEQSDANYRLPTKAQWQQIGKAFPMRGRKWIADVQDCDKFAKAFVGWLSMRGLGNMAVAFCGITPYDSAGTMLGGHAVALVMDSDKKLWFLDPQTGNLYEPTFAMLGGFFAAKTVKLARVYF